MLRLGVSAFQFYETRSHQEAWGYVGKALETMPDVAPILEARALMFWAESLASEIESDDVAEGKLRKILALYDRSLALARPTGDPDTLVRVLCRMSYSMNDASDVDAARKLVEEAGSVARGAANPRLIGIALMFEAWAKPFDDRKTLMLEAANWLRRAGDSATLCRALLVASARSTATVDEVREDRALNAEALQLADEIGYIRVKALLSGNLGIYCYVLGERAEATAHLRRCVRMVYRGGWPEYWLSFPAWALACLYADEGDYLGSAQLMGANERLSREAPEFFLRNRRAGKGELSQSIEDDVRRRSIENLGEEAYERVIAKGERLAKSQIVDLALGRSKAKT